MKWNSGHGEDFYFLNKQHSMATLEKVSFGVIGTLDGGLPCGFALL